MTDNVIILDRAAKSDRAMAYPITTPHARNDLVQDELALLARARSLEPEALAQIHDTYYTPIFRYIAFRVNNRDAAEDLTSEVFTRLLSALRDKHAPQNTLRGWLYGVASRVVSDYHRQSYRAPEVELDESLVSRELDPAEAVERMMTQENLKQAMTELTEEQQNVISLRFGYEMPIEEVARTLGKSEGAVKQLQARAIAALARKLSPSLAAD
jgi:RNA polymerase sigma-70 factor (ECF subfamily)